MSNLSFSRVRMCGMAVVLDDDVGGGDEEFGGDDDDGMRMLPPPPPPEVQCDDGGVWGPRRGRCQCVLWTVVLLLWNLALMTMCAGLLLLIFSVVLLPAALLLYTGFLCHSRVRRTTHNHKHTNTVSIVIL